MEVTTATLSEELTQLAEERARAEGLLANTLSRHKTAINAFADILNGSRTRITRPGRWIGAYSAEEATSTVVSNMKFLAAIMEWPGVQVHPDAELFARIAHAIRQALAVRAV
jgi:macrodomain Ter protein organizer (MatP/YcbG family)